MSTDLGQPDRNLALELVRVTEAAALAAATMVGRGDKIAADQAAVDAMHIVLKTIRMDGIVVWLVGTLRRWGQGGRGIWPRDGAAQRGDEGQCRDSKAGLIVQRAGQCRRLRRQSGTHPAIP